MGTKKKFGISFKTDGRRVSIDFNEKMIKKAGKLEITLDEYNTAHISLTDWWIGKRRRFHIFKRKNIGVLIKNDN